MHEYLSHDFHAWQAWDNGDFFMTYLFLSVADSSFISFPSLTHEGISNSSQLQAQLLTWNARFSSQVQSIKKPEKMILLKYTFTQCRKGIRRGRLVFSVCDVTMSL